MSASADLAVARPSSFVYKPLASSDAFRILHLQPALDLSAQVEGTLEYKTLREYQHEIISNYTALSYVWGNHSDLRIILLDGHVFNVTASLESALRHVRDERRVIQVWADALCIN